MVKFDTPMERHLPEERASSMARHVFRNGGIGVDGMHVRLLRIGRVLWVSWSFGLCFGSLLCGFLNNVDVE